MTSIFRLKTLSNILLALSNSLHYSCRPSPDSPHVSMWIFENQWKIVIFRFFQNLSKINRKRLQIRFLVSERLYQILEAFVLQYVAIAIILEASPKVWILGRNCKKMLNFINVGEEGKWPIAWPEMAGRTFYGYKRVLWSLLKSFHTVVIHRSPLHQDPHSFENNFWNDFFGVFLAQI